MNRTSLSVRILVATSIVAMAAMCAEGSTATATATAASSSDFLCTNSGGSGCHVGGQGPGGGVIFYDAGKVEWWGRFLEAAPVPYANFNGVKWTLERAANRSLYSGDAATVQRLRIDAKAIGMGKTNTAMIVAQAGTGSYAAYKISMYRRGGFSDWYLPSKDELNALYNFKAIVGAPSISSRPQWSSTEAWKNIAWYQLFSDGTQFSDSYILASKGGNKARATNVKYPGTNFPSLSYTATAVRAFPTGTGVVPPTSFPKLTGSTCTDAGPCVVGDIGPAGGVVFYVAEQAQSWGRYLEVSPKAAEVVGAPWRKPGYDALRDIIYDESFKPSRIKRVESKAIGMGAVNTKKIVGEYGAGRYAAKIASDYELNGYDDWFLPSADELDEMYNVLYAVDEPLSPFAPTYYWSSSEYDLYNAWTVLFRSGQRFDREGWFTAKNTGLPNAMRVRPIRAFG